MSAPPPDRINKEAWKWFGLKIAHDALMMNDAQKLLDIERQAVARHHAANYPTVPGGTVEPPGDDVIHVGDTIEHHHHHAPTPAGLSKLATAALVAGALLGGGGLGAVLVGALMPRGPAVQPTAPTATTEAAPQEWEVKWKVGPDGKWQTEVQPVRKP